MKKALRTARKVLFWLFFAIGLLCVLWAILSAVLTYRSAAAEKAELRADLNLPASQHLEVIELYDDHGGFLGDGQSLWLVNPGGVEGDPIDWTETDALDTADWNDLPISTSTADFSEGSDGWYLLNWKADLDEAENGKWLVVNRGEPADSGWLMNYTLYLYDSYLGTLYCYQFDS